ncbi:MAG: hypothetical protein M1829_004133 [Trizodia sp. TS-e1964]|nr:MAG: hypothetical protein M1829_004133 [Trizodia sp. TS-e1964]
MFSLAAPPARLNQTAPSSFFSSLTAGNNADPTVNTTAKGQAGMFGGLGGSQQQQHQPQQQQVHPPAIQFPSLQAAANPLSQPSILQQPGPFAQSQPQPLLQRSLLAVQPVASAQKSIVDQFRIVSEKWNVNSPDCAFQCYFYNKVPEEHASYYHPEPRDDPKRWSDALDKKPGPGYIPVLCVGFKELSYRIVTQQHNFRAYEARIHDLDRKLTQLLENHSLSTAIRAEAVKRKHATIQRRCLILATKVQVLRNRGYAMGVEEEALKLKLIALEKAVLDPGLNGRREEIWARMVAVRERAKILQDEMTRLGAKAVEESSNILDVKAMQKAEKILSDYSLQVAHLSKEMQTLQDEYDIWEKQNASKDKVDGRKDGKKDGKKDERGDDMEDSKEPEAIFGLSFDGATNRRQFASGSFM